MSEFHTVQSSVNQIRSMSQPATHWVLWHGKPEENLLYSHTSTYTSLSKDLRCHPPNNRYVWGYRLTKLEFCLGFILILKGLDGLILTAAVVRLRAVIIHLYSSFKCISMSVAWRFNFQEDNMINIKVNKEALLILDRYFERHDLFALKLICLYQV